MDSLTHLFIGGAIAAAIAPAGHRRAALLAGAAIDSLPDIDVLPLLLSDDPVTRMVWHRGMTHSLLLLPLVAWALWAWFRSRGGRVAQSPRRWFWVFQCALLAHPLLDAFTVYGTQLLWPLPVPPAMWSSLFIIDPLFSLCFIVPCVVAWRARDALRARRALLLGLTLAATYLGLSLLAKWRVETAAHEALAAQGLRDTPHFSVPMPFNILLWRVVALTPDGFVEGERSVVADRGRMVLRAHPVDASVIATARDYRAVQRLSWFNHGFMKVERHGLQLVATDLRMGLEPDYTFRFVVARRDSDGWREVAPQQLHWPWDAAGRLEAMWWRIWNDPLTSSPGSAPHAETIRSPGVSMACQPGPGCYGVSALRRSSSAATSARALVSTEAATRLPWFISWS